MALSSGIVLTQIGSNLYVIPGWASRESEAPMTTVSLGAVKPDHTYLYHPQWQPARLGDWLIGSTIGVRVQQKSSPRKIIH